MSPLCVGAPTEIKAGEHRVALTPAGVLELVSAGHQVVVQSGAGLGSGIVDEAYLAQGAVIVADAAAVFAVADLIVKVKEPQPEEVERLEPRHVLFTYLHLAADPGLTQALAASGATCVAYETVEDRAGRLPLLAPMSEVAGRLAAQAAASLLEKAHGGPGTLIGGVPGVAPAKVLVIGGGVVGLNAAVVAMGMGADVCVVDRDLDRLRQIDGAYETRMQTAYGSRLDVEERLADADVVVGAVLVTGARAPHVITRAQLALMRPGTVLVDVAIDQGGCFETSRPTTHGDPTYVVDGITHYCVANIPGAVPRTSTQALANATLRPLVQLAGGVRGALTADPLLRKGLNVAFGQIASAPVAEATGLPYVPAEDLLDGLPLAA